MAKINILPSQVYNRIAAGEVVDRPYSVVKELVENSIDAGATEIEVYIEKGGKQLIRVVDNGSGIERDDLHSAFLPHATSKLSKAEDLNSIMTLGFRGEAIASIASVSKMRIISKVKGGKCYSLSSNGGEIGAIEDCAGNDGTEVSVEMLFFNAPVRLTFLKTDKGEETDITSFMSRFILSRSDIAFTYYVDGKRVLQSFGTGDEEAFVSIYGASVHSQCIRIDGEKNGIRVRGYIGNQNYSKPNKSYMNVFLNGRYVLNSTISASITGAYGAYLMKRQYPFCVLHITVPPQIVDVNVHPNKADVRFANNNIIYGSIYKIISSVLDGTPVAMEYIVDKPTENVEVEIAKPQVKQESFDLFIEPTKQKQTTVTPTQQQGISESILRTPTIEKDEETPKVKEFVFDEKEKVEISDKSFGFASFTYEDAQRELQISADKIAKREQEIAEVRREDGYFAMDDIPKLDKSLLVSAKNGRRKITKKQSSSGKLQKLFPGVTMEREMLRFHDSEYESQQQAQTKGVDTFSANKRYLEELELKATQDKIDIDCCVYAGKLFNTYLMYECGENIYIIDQHASHERLIYNRLREKIRNRQVVCQPMLLPFELQVNPEESAFLQERMSEIVEIGFDIAQTSATCFAITAIPVDLPRIDIKAFFNQILSDIDGYRAIKVDEVLKDKLASVACKSAIKGGMDLTQSEALELLKQMDGDMSLKCPHGRPVVIKLTRTDLEKLFKRIV